MAPNCVDMSDCDKRELDKFTKFLAIKSAQIIVQSRLCERQSTESTAQMCPNDWFNLKINDIPDVSAEMRRVISANQKGSLPVCVEISLRTVDGVQMVLETWCLRLLPEKCDPTVRVTYHVYNKMGILLKSLCCTTRLTPAYKISRRQTPDSYMICYRIYMGDPQTQQLGPKHEEMKVGNIVTPMGTINFTVKYREDYTLSQNEQAANKENIQSDICDNIPGNQLIQSELLTKSKINDIQLGPPKIYPSISEETIKKFWPYKEKSKTEQAIDDYFNEREKRALEQSKVVEPASPKLAPVVEMKPVVKSTINSTSRKDSEIITKPVPLPFAKKDLTPETTLMSLYFMFCQAPSWGQMESASDPESDLAEEVKELVKKRDQYKAFAKKLVKSGKGEESSEMEQSRTEKKGRRKRNASAGDVLMQAVDTVDAALITRTKPGGRQKSYSECHTTATSNLSRVLDSDDCGLVLNLNLDEANQNGSVESGHHSSDSRNPSNRSSLSNEVFRMDDPTGSGTTKDSLTTCCGNLSLNDSKHVGVGSD